MAITMLESPVRNKTYGSPKAWDYMEKYLCGNHDFKACIYYLKGEAQALARLGTELIRVASLGSIEFLALLFNN